MKIKFTSRKNALVFFLALCFPLIVSASDYETTASTPFQETKNRSFIKQSDAHYTYTVGNFDVGNGRHGSYIMTQSMTISELYNAVRLTDDPLLYDPSDYNAIPNFIDFTVANNAVLSATAYNGSEGGTIILRAQGMVLILSNSVVDVSERGYRGGAGTDGAYTNGNGIQGESYTGTPIKARTANFGGGGGGERWTGSSGRSPVYGGGGGYGTVGAKGSGGGIVEPYHGAGGNTYGNSSVSILYLGSGGGGGSELQSARTGGSGGGSALLEGNEIYIAGKVEADGADSNGGGGGSGGSVVLRGAICSIADVTAIGGRGDVGTYYTGGGHGGDGRIRIDYLNSISILGTIQPTGTLGSLYDPGYYTLTMQLSETIVATNAPFTVTAHSILPGTVLYRFKCEDVWSPWGTSNSKSLSCYTYGNRMILVQARNDSGVIACGITNIFVNARPVASVSNADIWVSYAGTFVTIDGTPSYDPDGSILNKYYWREMLNNPVIGLISTSNSSSITVRPWWPGEYTFELVVADSSGTLSALSAPATARIMVPGFVGKVFVSQTSKKLRIANATGTVDGQSVTATSNDDGEFVIPAWDSWGAITLRVNAEGYHEWAQSSVPIVYSQKPTTVTMQAEAGNQWQGKIVDAVTQNGIASATIDVAPGSGFTTLTQGGTGSSRGEFSIESPPLGLQRVVINKSGYEPFVFSIRFPDVNYRTIELTPISSQVARKLHGHVYASGTTIPIGSIYVALEGVTGFDGQSLVATSDSTGYYAINDVPVGQYRLVASVDYDTASDMTFKPYVQTAIIQGGQDTGQNIELGGGVYGVYGGVTDQNGYALTNAIIRYAGSGTTSVRAAKRGMKVDDETSRDRTITTSANPDGSGYYGIQVPAGTRQVQISAPGYQTTTLDVSLTNHVRQDIVLTSGSDITPPVGVSATDGTLSDRVRVSWTTVDGATAYEVWRNTSDSSGGAAQVGTALSATYDDTSSSGEVVYYYWVKSKNDTSTSGFSSPDSGYTGVVVGPLITANGLVGNVYLNNGDAVTIAVQMMNIGSYLGVEVDWWVVASANLSDWYYLNGTPEWKEAAFSGNNYTVFHPVYQGPLLNLSSTEVLSGFTLPPGTYDFWFAVDYPMDGILDINGQFLVDSVNVVVQ